MNFRTEINITPFPFQLNHKDKIMLMGSCFTQNIGKHLSQNQFNTLENPYGITFNPLSVVEQLREILDLRVYTTKDIDLINQRYISFNHHSAFNSAKADKLTAEINQHMSAAHHFLKTAKVLFISLGTAWVWNHIAKNKVVNNCHKLPAKQFNYTLATADEIINTFSELIKELKKFNPKLQVVFTVSPVRHWRNGAIDNSRSKAVLLTAVNQLAHNFSNAHYFPSYEIMMDDLRDYRFYKDDLLHPTEMAINYIWQKFTDAFFSSQTLKSNSAIAKINAMQNHRHIATTDYEMEKFNAKLKQRKMELKQKYDVDFLE